MEIENIIEEDERVSEKEIEKKNENENGTKKKIKNVSEYLNEIKSCINTLKYDTGSDFYCFRGEDRMASDNGVPYSPGMPNIFRDPNFDNFNKVRLFEKNILDEIKANKLSEGDSYLEIAMDAQHGGFPSRLLDVTFNALIALFFAVTPHYTKGITSNDEEDGDSKEDKDGKKDGRVIIYAIDKMTTSNSEQIIDIYKNIINKKEYINRLHGYNHIFIDFVDLNNRIRAQQGGFILFGGDQYIPVPSYMYEEITISARHKKKIRQELDRLFGINMGTIYPEISNKVNYLMSRSNIIENDIDYYVEIKNEVDNALKRYTDELKRIFYDKERDEDKFKKILKDISRYVRGIVLSHMVFSDNLPHESGDNQNDKVVIEHIEELRNYVVNHIKNINVILEPEFGDQFLCEEICNSKEKDQY